MKLNSAYSLLVAAAATVALASCGSSDKADDSKSSQPEIEISSESYDFDILSAKQAYKFTVDTTTYYLTLEANVQYPEKIGDYDIKNLQDTLGTFITGKRKAESIEDAMRTFLTNLDDIGPEGPVTAIDSVPASASEVNTYFSNVDVKLNEITPNMLTFNCIFQQYLGGVHPMYGCSPFTYLLAEGRIVDYQWLFVPGSEEVVTAQIRDAILAQTGLTDKELSDAMLTTFLPIPETVYIEGGDIVFHYNPYAILPYVYGMIDAKVSPYLVTDQLTPAAKALLID
ncbi:MAG: DUF3298 and DUF4163 domain-containing protein [Bacteroides sp.]|nr:DUF3298 and DUF4163 domain-containing protein [Bacteroides sp.]